MPFKSQSQRKWMYANHPAMAKRWEAHTPKGKKLPKRKRKVRNILGVSNAFCPTGEGGGIDPTCSPVRGFHGTEAQFEQFDPEKNRLSPRGSSGALGVFFAVSKREAQHYGKRIIEAELHLSNIKTISDDEYREATNSRADARKMRERLVSAGYDGAWVPHLREYIVFDVSKIRQVHNASSLPGVGRVAFRRDPTRTLTLRKALRRDIKRAFAEVKLAAANAAIHQRQLVYNAAWFSSARVPTAAIFQPHLQRAYAAGLADAFDQVRNKRGEPRGWKERYQYVRDKLLRKRAAGGSILLAANAEARMTIKGLASHLHETMDDITKRMSRDLARVLKEGLEAGANPKRIARELVARVDIEEARALRLARTSVSAYRAEGQLDAFEDLGEDEVTANVEWETADAPCPMCAPMAGVVLSVEEARGLIPRHPNCLCSWSAVQEKVDRRALKRAERASKREAWSGDDWDITGNLLRFDSLLNAFCPTGPGGGIDPTCSPGEGSMPKVGDTVSYGGVEYTVSGTGLPIKRGPNKGKTALVLIDKSGNRTSAFPDQLDSRTTPPSRKEPSKSPSSATGGRVEYKLDTMGTSEDESQALRKEYLRGKDYANRTQSEREVEAALERASVEGEKVLKWAIREKGKVVAAAAVVDSGKVLEIDHVGSEVKGGGSALVNKIIAQAAKDGKGLFIQRINPGSESFWKKVGLGREGHYDSKYVRGLAEDRGISLNVFCPTGPGGGIDPTCSPGGGEAAQGPLDDPRLPPAGTVLKRAYKGEVHEVKVLEDGFEYKGDKYSSLSKVGKRITGQETNGFTFFKLGKGTPREKPVVDKPAPKPETKTEPSKPVGDSEAAAYAGGVRERMVAAVDRHTRELADLERQHRELKDEVHQLIEITKGRDLTMAEAVKVDDLIQQSAKIAQHRARFDQVAREALYVEESRRYPEERFGGVEVPRSLSKMIGPAEEFLRGVVAQDERSGYHVKYEALRGRNGRAYHVGYHLGGEPNSSVNLSGASGIATAVHEWGHALEHLNPAIGRASREFLNKRVGDEPLKHMGPGYGADEMGRDDDFGKAFGKDARYVGKYYSSGSTEILSMGLQKLYQDPINFAKRDPEYFDFVIGVAHGKIRR